MDPMQVISEVRQAQALLRIAQHRLEVLAQYGKNHFEEIRDLSELFDRCGILALKIQDAFFRTSVFSDSLGAGCMSARLQSMNHVLESINDYVREISQQR